jgi:predicted nucleic acid-binding protein
VIDAVLDASVVLKWFRQDGERNLGAARSLRAAYEAGELVVLAPPLFGLELVNVAGRRWGCGERALIDLARALDDLGFELIEPELMSVAQWTARGLTAYDAAYVALAEKEGVRLVTDDEQIISTAPSIATALPNVGTG